MRLSWNSSGPHGDVFRTTTIFIENRLADARAIDWALRLTDPNEVERDAVKSVLGMQATKLGEPWRSAWRYIEESWSLELTEPVQEIERYDVGERLRSGERTASVADALVRLVRPWIKASKSSESGEGSRRKPKTVSDLLSLSLESGRLIKPADIHLQEVDDGAFLLDVASALDSAVARGLSSAARALGDVSSALWRLGDLARVEFVDGGRDEGDPDSFHTGIAPSVKLLSYVVDRLGPDAAQSFVAKWEAFSHPVYRRLWAHAAANRQLVGAARIETFLTECSHDEFWDLYRFPEISALRAARFNELSEASRLQISKRVQQGPPITFWPRNADKSQVQQARDYNALRELRRIQVMMGELPPASSSWVAANSARFPELQGDMSPDEGFREAPRAAWLKPKPDDRYDFVDGVARLKLLAEAFKSDRGGWDDDPASRASDWINKDSNAALLIADLEATHDAGAEFSPVWNRFGWAHKPNDEKNPSNLGEGLRVIHLLDRLPLSTLDAALDGLAHWLDRWGGYLKGNEEAMHVWLQIWPIAERHTNAQQENPTAEPSLDLVARAEGAGEPRDLDTLNTPAGKLIGSFLGMCPPIRSRGDKPFAGTTIGVMRDVAVGSTGRSLLIALHRFIEQIAYFLRADGDWTRKELVQPLMEEGPRSLMLWRAIGRITRRGDVLKILGRAMARKATDLQLGRETRRSLAFSLVVEALHALREQRHAAIPMHEIQQMLRSLDDEVRAYAADIVPRFVKEMSSSNPDIAKETLFYSAAKPFLDEVWPHDRTLVTPAVSRAFAELPARCGTAFAEAVKCIEPFLVPFESWSLLHYGLHGSSDGVPRLRGIDSVDKAKALLLLLDRTVSDKEGAVVPSDLSAALERISSVAPRLAEDSAFRRLSALARR